MCIYIDRKICRGYTQPRIIYTNFRMDDKVFNGTLVHGELVKMPNNKWIFMINDIMAYCGEKLTHTDKITRIKCIYKLLRQHYTYDSILDVCELQVKRYFTYKEMPKMLQLVPKLPYQVNGLVFNTLRSGKPDILLLHNFENKYISADNKVNDNKINDNTNVINTSTKSDKTISTKNDTKDINETIDLSPTMSMASMSVKPVSSIKVPTVNIRKELVVNTMKKSHKTDNKTRTFTFILSKIEGGIFQLISLVNKNEKIFGIARIDKMKTQKMVINALMNSNIENRVLMNCTYNMKFNKFVPVSISENTEADQFLDVTNYIKSMAN